MPMLLISLLLLLPTPPPMLLPPNTTLNLLAVFVVGVTIFPAAFASRVVVVAAATKGFPSKFRAQL